MEQNEYKDPFDLIMEATKVDDTESNPIIENTTDTTEEKKDLKDITSNNNNDMKELSDLGKLYKEYSLSIDDILPNLDKDYINGTLTKESYDSLKEELTAYIEEVRQESIMSMLPQGCGYEDEDVVIPPEIDDYVNNSDVESNPVLEAAIQTFMVPMMESVNCSSKLKMLTSKQELLKEKLANAKKDGSEAEKIADLKHELVKINMDVRNERKKCDVEDSDKVKEIASNVAKKSSNGYNRAIKECADDVIVESGSSAILDMANGISAITPILIGGAITITGYRLAHTKKALQIYEDCNKDLIPFSKLKKRTYKIKSHSYDDTKGQEVTNKALKWLKENMGSYIVTFNDGDREIFSIVSKRKSNSVSLESSYQFYPSNAMAKKHRKYYITAYLNSRRVVTRDSWQFALSIDKSASNYEKDKTVKESVDELFTEARNIDPEIKPIVDKLNDLGYKVKYASPGHENLRKKEDKTKDGLYYGHLYSDARIMFQDDYKLSEAPKYWRWKKVDGCDYLDVKPLSSDEGGKEKFAEWKNKYMSSLSDWVASLNKVDDTITKESVDDLFNDIMNEITTELSL